MTHKVYAFIGKQPYGLVDHFRSLKEAKDCAIRVERDGLKVDGTLHPANVRIIAKTA